MNYYLWWPLVLVFLCLVNSYCVFKNIMNHTIWWLTTVIIFNSCFGLLYAILIRYTKNVILDTLLFSVIITIMGAITLSYFGFSKSFGWFQWSGICLIIIGLIVFKLK